MTQKEMKNSTMKARALSALSLMLIALISISTCKFQGASEVYAPNQNLSDLVIIPRNKYRIKIEETSSRQLVDLDAVFNITGPIWDPLLEWTVNRKNKSRFPNHMKIIPRISLVENATNMRPPNKQVLSNGDELTHWNVFGEISVLVYTKKRSSLAKNSSTLLTRKKENEASDEVGKAFGNSSISFYRLNKTYGDRKVVGGACWGSQLVRYLNSPSKTIGREDPREKVGGDRVGSEGQEGDQKIVVICDKKSNSGEGSSLVLYSANSSSFEVFNEKEIDLRIPAGSKIALMGELLGVFVLGLDKTLTLSLSTKISSSIASIQTQTITNGCSSFDFYPVESQLESSKAKISSEIYSVVVVCGEDSVAVETKNHFKVGKERNQQLLSFFEVNVNITGVTKKVTVRKYNSSLVSNLPFKKMKDFNCYSLKTSKNQLFDQNGLKTEQGANQSTTTSLECYFLLELTPRLNQNSTIADLSFQIDQTNQKVLSFKTKATHNLFPGFNISSYILRDEIAVFEGWKNKTEAGFQLIKIGARNSSSVLQGSSADSLPATVIKSSQLSQECLNSQNNTKFTNYQAVYLPESSEYLLVLRACQSAPVNQALFKKEIFEQSSQKVKENVEKHPDFFYFRAGNLTLELINPSESTFSNTKVVFSGYPKVAIDLKSFFIYTHHLKTSDVVDFVVIYTLALIVALTFALIIIRMIKKNNQKEITEGLFRLTKIDITYKATTMQFGYFKQIDTGLTNEGESNEVDSTVVEKGAFTFGSGSGNNMGTTSHTVFSVSDSGDVDEDEEEEKAEIGMPLHRRVRADSRWIDKTNPSLLI